MAVRKGVWMIVGVGLAVSLLLAGVVSFYASSSPDGLEKVAGDIGFIESAEDSAVTDSPLSGYAVSGVDDGRLSGGLAGVVGVALVAAIAFGLFTWLARRRRHETVDTTAGG
jgi:hypothetical protein